MQRKQSAGQRSEFLEALKQGIWLGLAILVLVIPALRFWPRDSLPAQPPAPVARTVPVPQPAPAPQEAPSPPAFRLADFGDADPSPEARHVAHWSVASGDHGRRAFVIVDKKDAHVYVFGNDGRLKAHAPALLGSATGDHTVPGIGDKPLSQVLPHEKTTPAGRFIAEPGINTKGEDIIWVDYDAAVSMHRVRNVKNEQRLERLASPGVDDNRISFGCINLPVSFYEQVLSPTVKQSGAVVYVLPETRTPQEVFGSFDVPLGPSSAGLPAKQAPAVAVPSRAAAPHG